MLCCLKKVLNSLKVWINNICLIILSLGISYFAFAPHEDIPKDIDNLNANILHVFTFFVISICFYNIKKYSYLQVFFIVITLGICIEIVQGLFTTREFSVFDLGYDIIGYSLMYILNFSKNLIFKR